MPTSTRCWALLGALTSAGFLGSWALLHHSFWGRHQIVDTPLYERYGDAMRAGRMPYRDFAVEYPPGALAAFLAPELTARPRKFGDYGHAFEKWMAACGVALVVGVVAALARLGARPQRAGVVCVLVALSPLLLGSVFLSRFDALPAMLTVWALVALLAARVRLSAVVLGVAVAVKLYPLVLVPLALIWMLKVCGRRAAAVWAVTFAVVLVACFAPFVVFSPRGVAHSFGVQLSRPLQVESLGAALLVFAHHALGLKLVVRNGHHSKNVLGALPHTVSVLTSVVATMLLVASYALFARGPATRQRLVAAAAACVCTFVGFGKVFSPQYMIWLIPLVPLVGGRAGFVASAALAAALVLTQAWFPGRYGLYADHLRPLESAFVLGRDLVVAAVAVGLIACLRGGSQRGARRRVPLRLRRIGAVAVLALLTPAVAGAARHPRALPVVAVGYGWPLRPFDRQHAIRGWFGDPRFGRVQRNFHFGIDIPAPGNTPVYAVAAGTAYLAPDRVSVLVGNLPRHASGFAYWHILPAVTEHAFVRKDALVGWVSSAWGHLHFAQLLDGQWVNPLQPGALTPFRDSQRPHIEAVDVDVHRGDEATGTPPSVDLYVDASMNPPTVLPPPWQGTQIAPTMLRWRLLEGDRVVVDWQTPVDFRVHIPPNWMYPEIYAPGTVPNHPNESGRYRFYLARNWTLSGLAPGMYTVEVEAFGPRGSESMASRPLEVPTVAGAAPGRR